MFGTLPRFAYIASKIGFTSGGAFERSTLLSRPMSVSRGGDGGRFDHEHDRARRHPRPVHHALRNDHALARRELHRAPLEIEMKQALEHEEELVLAVVLVPVE